MLQRAAPSLWIFLSTPSARRATTAGEAMPLHLQISIHALREEGDFRRSGLLPRLPEFLSTPSARRATSCTGRAAHRPNHFYPRPPRGGRHCGSMVLSSTILISIHALREEGDGRRAAATA